MNWENRFQKNQIKKISKLNLKNWANHLEKNQIRKIEKKTKNQSQIAACEQKRPAKKRIFVQTPFSHFTFKLEWKKIHAAKTLALSLHFLFRRDQNHYSNLTSKIVKTCEQILKKISAPIQFKYFEL